VLLLGDVLIIFGPFSAGWKVLLERIDGYLLKAARGSELCIGRSQPQAFRLGDFKCYLSVGYFTIAAN
jgi:hypothetical protein